MSVHEYVSGSDLSVDCGIRILRAMRRIIRSVDLHSREMVQRFQITTPQMVCLSVVSESQGITLSKLADSVSLCASTVTGIVDRLEARGLVRRRRASNDRRKITLVITAAGRQLIAAAPPLLQDKFSARLSALPELEQVTIALSLERIVDMMGAGDLSTSPHLMINQESVPAKEPESINQEDLKR
ncbi:MAG: MarR family winged helix-turn-helix transcriptional regulator [Lentisphaeria bacterium]|nr:MarR family winged helix-turn-helix transcriptional regulator [Lentisphaeria bacterium]